MSRVMNVSSIMGRQEDSGRVYEDLGLRDDGEELKKVIVRSEQASSVDSGCMADSNRCRMFGWNNNDKMMLDSRDCFFGGFL